MSNAARDWIKRHEVLAAVLAFFAVVVGILLFHRHIQATVVVYAVLIGVFITWMQYPVVPLETSAAGTPVMTIGTHLSRTNALFQRVILPVVIAWIAAVTLFVTGIPKWEQYALSVGGGVALFLIGWLFVRNQLRCPRCGTDFSKERIALLGRWTLDTRGTADLWASCPRCGVSFNDPWP